MSPSMRNARCTARAVRAQLPAYAAFGVSLVFAAAILLGFIG